MKPRLVTLPFVAALLLALGGCGDGSTSNTAAASKESTPAVREVLEGGEASIEEFGEEAEGSDREEILAAFTGYLGAIADKDYAAACSYLSVTVQTSLERLSGKGSKGGCEASLPKLLSPTAGQVARRQAEGKVTKVRIEGDRAFVVFKAPGAELYQETMMSEGGRWKAASVGAAVLVPELR